MSVAPSSALAARHGPFKAFSNGLLGMFSLLDCIDDPSVLAARGFQAVSFVPDSFQTCNLILPRQGGFTVRSRSNQVDLQVPYLRNSPQVIGILLLVIFILQFFIIFLMKNAVHSAVHSSELLKRVSRICADSSMNRDFDH
ncbi:hypothetical protein [Mesorhizobium sp. RIZ17]|uniref:hypothetical protein n=1 Tax=Mesorhizobium sp. RIZ17 TaxID=3132743 RepID=UPI003DA98CB6